MAASWRINERFTVGPGVGVFNTLDDTDDYDVFPVLLINWQVTDRLSVGNGDGFGASQGSGIGISYKARDDLATGLFVRSDSTEFRLDNSGLAPGGFGKDKATSVVGTASYQPNDKIDISGFLGVELGGQLTLRDSDGDTIDRRDYDPAPIIGVKVAVRF